VRERGVGKSKAAKAPEERQSCCPSLPALPGLGWQSRPIPQLTLWATLWPLLRSFGLRFSVRACASPLPCSRLSRLPSA